MEPDDFFVRSRSVSPDPTLGLGEQAPLNQITDSLIPRSRSHEDLQRVVAEAQSIHSHDVQSGKQLQDLKSLLKDEFEYCFVQSRSLFPEQSLMARQENLMNRLRSRHPVLSKLSEKEYAIFQTYVITMSNSILFPSPATIEKVTGKSAQKYEYIYTPSYLAEAYDKVQRGECLYSARIFLSHSATCFSYNLDPALFWYQFIELSAEIFEATFNEYQGKPFMYILKNALICLSVFEKIYLKLVSDTFLSFDVRMYCENYQFFLAPYDTYENSIFSFKADRFIALRQLRDQKLESIDSVYNLIAAFKAQYRDFQEGLMSQPFFAFIDSYCNFYLSKHSSLKAALENPNPFPDEILREFSEKKPIDVASMSRALKVEFERNMLYVGRYNFEHYFTRDHYRLTFDHKLYSNLVAVLKKKYEALFSQRLLEDEYISEIHSLIMPIFQKLNQIDLASPAYKVEDVNAIIRDLRTLRQYLETLTGFVDLIKSGDVKIDSHKKPQPIKKKKNVRKKKKKVQEPAPVIVTDVQPVSTPALPSVKPIKSKVTPQKREELETIRVISRRITENLEKENQFYENAKTYILKQMSNDTGCKLVEVLFDLKSNLKNIISEADMKLIMTQLMRAFLPQKIQVKIEGLKGSNGFRFRVGDEIYTSHASSAQIGHKGHGGAIKDFRDFLIAIYALSLKKK